MIEETTNEQLLKHRELALKLKDVKEEESELRITICDDILNGEPYGTNRFETDIFDIKSVKKKNFSLDKKISDLYDDLSDEEMECIRFVPEINLKIYKSYKKEGLTDDLDELITVSDAMPTLEITYKE